MPMLVHLKVKREAFRITAWLPQDFYFGKNWCLIFFSKYLFDLLICIYSPWLMMEDRNMVWWGWVNLIWLLLSSVPQASTNFLIFEHVENDISLISRTCSCRITFWLPINNLQTISQNNMFSCSIWRALWIINKRVTQHVNLCH